MDREAFQALPWAEQEAAIQAAPAELKSELAKLQKEAILIRRYGEDAYRRRIQWEAITRRGFQPLAQLGYFQMVSQDRYASQKSFTMGLPGSPRAAVQAIRKAGDHTSKVSRDFYEKYLPLLVGLAPTPEAFALQRSAEFSLERYRLLAETPNQVSQETMMANEAAINQTVHSIEQQLEKLPRLSAAEVQAEINAETEKLVSQDFINY